MSKAVNIILFIVSILVMVAANYSPIVRATFPINVLFSFFGGVGVGLFGCMLYEK